MAANLDSWVSDVDDDKAFQARGRASTDREHSKSDRTSSAEDRRNLSQDGNPETPDRDDGSDATNEP
jgi:hypothetical protein